MEGIYLLELANGTIKVGKSTDLSSRLREHERNIAMAGATLIQSWTYSVQQSEQVEARVINLFHALPHVRLAGGRELFKGLSFFEAMALAKDVCVQYERAESVAEEAVSAGTPEVLASVFTDIVDVMDEAGVDRMPFREIHRRLAGRNEKYAELPAGEVQKQLWRSGVTARRYRTASNANPIRGYYRSDLLQHIRTTRRRLRRNAS